MVRKLLAVVFVLALAVTLPAWAGDGVTKEKVTQLVETTVTDLAADAPGTIAKINKGEHPYKDKDNPAAYVFVYDTEVNMVAHPQAGLVGRNFKGKPDVRGKKFRDEIVEKATSAGSGWVEYAYTQPGETGVHPKTTYCKMVKGNDGKAYVVCAGMYL